MTTTHLTREETIPETPGHDALWNWFELSRASWLTIPRSLLHEMPDDWQAKMAALLEEYDRTFSGISGVTSHVQIREHGRITSAYNWLLDYRHPDMAKLESLKT